jgi:class 3 adenylate cyclase
MTTFEVEHVTGIDTGVVFAAKIGIRGANDIVWVGPPANHAAKLTDRSPQRPTWITEAVYDDLDVDSCYDDMWVVQWDDVEGWLYYSTYSWSFA